MFFLWCIVRLLALLGLAVAGVAGQSPSATGTSVSTPLPAKAVTSPSLSTVTVSVTVEITTGTAFPVPEAFTNGTSTITVFEDATRTSTETITVSVTLSSGVPPPPVAPRSALEPLFTEGGSPPPPSVTTEFETWTYTVPNLTTIAGSTRTNYEYEVTRIGPVVTTTVTVTTTLYLIPVTTVPDDGPSTSALSAPDTSTTTSVSRSISTVRTSFFNSPRTNTSKGTMMTMRTTSASSTSETPTGTATPVPPPDDFNSLDGGRTRKAGLIIGCILAGVLVLGLMFWLVRKLKRRRNEKKILRELILPQTAGSRRDRRIQREFAAPQTGGSAGVIGAMRTNSRRQNLGFGPRLTRSTRGPPGPPGPSGPPQGSPYSTESGSHSGLTGEGEVRIVIRPAPSRRRTASSELMWPIPPGRSGPDISLYMEQSTSRDASTSPENPDDWSIASDQGSRNSPFRSAGPSQGSSGGRQETYPMVTILSPTPANHRDRRNVAPWETPTPLRSATEPTAQGSPGSGGTARTGRSSNRPLLGGSNRFSDII